MGVSPWLPSGRAVSGDYVVIRDIGIGAAAVVLAALLAVVLYPAGDPVGRVVVMALACGGVGAVLTDRRAVAVTVVIAAVVFVVVLADQVAAGRALPYMPVLGLAAALGVGYRWLERAERSSLRSRDDQA